MKVKISELIEFKESIQKNLASLQATSKRIENIISDTPDGSAQDIESKLKALELDFDLDSKIKQIEEKYYATKEN